MSEETKKPETALIEANDHTYEFIVLDTLHGLGVYHRWLRYFGENVDEISKALRELFKSKEANSIELFKALISGEQVFLRLRELLIKALDMDTLFELCSTFLSGATIDDEECDELGMCASFRRTPHEIYTALILAVAANYPDYFPFILKGLDTGASLSPK